MNVDFVPFIRSVRVLCKPRPEQAAAYFLSYKRPYCLLRHSTFFDFDILASGKTDFHCKIKETLFIQEIKSSLNVNISSEKLLLF